MVGALLWTLLAIGSVAGSAAGAQPAARFAPGFPESSYRPPPAEDFVLFAETILTGDGGRIDNGSIRVVDGRIVEIAGDRLPARGLTEYDAGQAWVTPGLIDVDSRLGTLPAEDSAIPGAGTNGQALTARPVLRVQDPAFGQALAAGITTVQVSPRRGGHTHGWSLTLKNVYGLSTADMMFPGAPEALNLTCEESGGPGREAERSLIAYAAESGVSLQVHCDPAEGIARILQTGQALGVRPGLLQRAGEGYKLIERLAFDDSCVAARAQPTGLAGDDAIPENLAMLEAAGVCTVLYSGDPSRVRLLNQEAARAMAAGRRAGIPVAPEQAIAWITANPALALGLASETGNLAPGKAADLVVWDGDPFSVYSRPLRVYIDGARVYDRGDPARQPRSDLQLGEARIGSGERP